MRICMRLSPRLSIPRPRPRTPPAGAAGPSFGAPPAPGLITRIKPSSSVPRLPSSPGCRRAFLHATMAPDSPRPRPRVALWNSFVSSGVPASRMRHFPAAPVPWPLLWPLRSAALPPLRAPVSQGRGRARAGCPSGRGGPGRRAGPLRPRSRAPSGAVTPAQGPASRAPPQDMVQRHSEQLGGPLRADLFLF